MRSPRQILLVMQSVLLLLTLISCATAAPSSPAARRADNSNSGSTSNSTSIYVPIVVVAVLVAIAAVFACGGRNLRHRFAMSGALAAGQVATTGSQPTTLTADQLAGRSSTQGRRGTPATRTARTRRARPGSVRSTKSLPLYMKEPGDEEVVIFRGPDDLEDENIQTTIILPPVDESGEHTPNGSLDLRRSISRGSVYTPNTHSGQDTPLLEGQEHVPHGDVRASGDHATRRSLDSTNSEDAARMMASPEVLERGEAPPYFEAVGMDSGVDLLESVPTSSGNIQARSNPIPDASGPSPAHAEDNNAETATSRTGRRISGFFGGIFHHRNSVHARMPAAPASTRPSRDQSNHTRDASVPSMASVASSARPGSALDRTHRPSHSGGSAMSLGTTMFRARSRDLLNSPSAISLNSISAPLAHTLVRTELTYPKAGPTPQQMKLISSFDSFSRFGVPYGPDAVAYASTSRMSLDPPPEFEEVASRSTSQLSQNALERAETSAPTMDEHAAQTQDAEQSPEVPETEAQEPEGDSAVAASQTISAGGEHEAVAPSSAEPAQPSTSVATQKAPKTAPPPSSFKVFPPPSIGASSRASSVASFATADEFQSSDSTPSTPTTARIITLDISDTPMSPASPTRIELETPTASTPRTITRHAFDAADTTVTSAPLRPENAIETR